METGPFNENEISEIKGIQDGLVTEATNVYQTIYRYQLDFQEAISGFENNVSSPELLASQYEKSQIIEPSIKDFRNAIEAMIDIYRLFHKSDESCETELYEAYMQASGKITLYCEIIKRHLLIVGTPHEINTFETPSVVDDSPKNSLERAMDNPVTIDEAISIVKDFIERRFDFYHISKELNNKILQYIGKHNKDLVLKDAISLIPYVIKQFENGEIIPQFIPQALISYWKSTIVRTEVNKDDTSAPIELKEFESKYRIKKDEYYTFLENLFTLDKGFLKRHFD